MKSIGRVSNTKIEDSREFNYMSYLKDNRNWIIEKILEFNSRSQLVACMEAIKVAVQDCYCDNEADEIVLDVAMLSNFDRKQFTQDNHDALQERKRNVFG